MIENVFPSRSVISQEKTNQTDGTKYPIELTHELLRNLSTLQVTVHGDFSPVLDALNESLGISLRPRPEGFHLTIITPQESWKLAELSQDQITQLQKIIDDIQSGKGIYVAGIGYIDGATMPNIRAADKGKKAAFLAVDSPVLQQWRQSLGMNC